MSVGGSGRRPLLVIAHPGHELRLYGWMRKTRPLVAILTDGSGSTGISRIDLSRELCADAGADVVIEGRIAEPEFYAAVMRRDATPFIAFAEELAQLMGTHRIDTLVCDAVEGYHPAHDLCLPLTRTAIALRRPSAQDVRHLEYRVIGHPGRDDARGTELAAELDDAQWRDKLDRSRGYAAASGTVLAQEVEYMFDTFGEEAFRHEVLRPAGSEHPKLYDGLRYFEMRGEQQVRAGRYSTVLRYAEHLQPIEAALHACC